MTHERQPVNKGRYKFKKLEDDRHIRILTVLGGNEEKIMCKIRQHPLPDLKAKGAPADATSFVEYEAVSWTWGDEDEIIRSIWILDEETDKTGKTMITESSFAVRPNLFNALKRLRKVSESRNLWVDAICIHQDHEHEKNLQVAMMAEIYSLAKNVCVWLGEFGDNSDRALEFIKEHVSDLGAFEEITNQKRFADDWKALAALMIRPWFSRRWVVQEIAVARDATIHCGTKTVNWTDFETAVSLFERDAARIASFYRDSQVAQYDADLFGDVAAMGAARLVQAKSNLFRRNDDGTIVERRLTLSELVANLTSFEAKVPHDMVYAILALAKDTHAKTTAKDGDAKAAEAAAATPTAEQSVRSSTASLPNVNVPSRSAAEQSLMPVGFPRRPEMPGGFPCEEEGWVPTFKPSMEPTPTSPKHPPSPSPELLSGEDERKGRAVLSKLRLVTKPQNARIFQVNYKQPFFEVCKQFLAFAIPKAEGHNLDILCRPWAPELGEDDEKLPTWILDVSNSPFGERKANHAPGGYQTTRKNFDPLVGVTTFGRPYYNACHSQSALNDPNRMDWHFGDSEDTKRSLYVTGFILDAIGKLEEPSQNGNVPLSWFHCAGWYPEKRRGRQAIKAPPERLWRTLIADRGADGTNAKVYYPQAFKYAVTHSTPQNGLEAAELSNQTNPILVEFLKRMRAVVWNRRLFLSKSKPYHLGLAPKMAQPEDCICILRGCSVPVLLRKVAGTGHFEFIGECYVHTMMDGKAIEVQEDRNLKTQKFELR